MSIIFRIAKAELRNLFYSPVAWVIIVAFFAVCGMQFADALVVFAARQQFNQENMEMFSGFNTSLTLDLFGGAYEFLLSKIFLFIPLLTMSIISREVHGGTIKLLNSSPVRTSDIVLGKFTGMAIFNLILMVPVALLMFTGYLSIKDPDTNIFFTALLGIYLLTCTYTAIGIFVSALTNYPIVAALCTLLLFIFLNIITIFWQEYDFFRDLSWFLNISGRVENLLLGLITTNDIIYFLLIILLFVGFTCIKLYNRQESRKKYVYFSRYVFLFLVVMMLGYLSSRPGYIGYADVTKGQVNTLHPEAQKVVKELGEDPLTVTLYVNLMDPSMQNGLPSVRNKYIWTFWQGYQRFHPEINYQYVYYYDLMDDDTMFRKTYPNKTLEEVARKTIKLYGLPSGLFRNPGEIRQLIDLSGESKRMVMQLEYKGRKTFLRTYEDIKFWPDQPHVAAAISRLTRNKPPRIIFSTGHYERSPARLGEREYADHMLNKGSRQAMLNNGADADTVNLETHDIPSNTDLLVLADPKSALSADAEQKLTTWLKNGGNAILYGEPGKQEMLNNILASIGIKLNDGLLVTSRDYGLPHQLETMYTDTALYMAEEPELVKARKGKDTIGFMDNSTASISYEERNGFRIEPLFQIPGKENIWVENGMYLADSAAPFFSAAAGDLKEKLYVTGIKLTRTINGREQRIVVTADADFMSRLRHSGGIFRNAAYSWSLGNEYPVYVNYPDPEDRLLTINRKMAKTIRMAAVYIVPAIVLLAGITLLIRRKRK